MLKIEKVDLEKMGFKDLTLEDKDRHLKHIVYEYFDKESATHFLLSARGSEWVLCDGRPTVDKVFYSGEFPTEAQLISLMLQNAGNLNRSF